MTLEIKEEGESRKVSLRMLLACYGWKTKSRNQRERKREMSQRKWGKGYVELWETIWKRGEWSKE